MQKKDMYGRIYQADGVVLTCGCETGKQGAIVGEATVCLTCGTVEEVQSIIRVGR